MNGYKKLGRNSAHRKSMLRNLVTDLFREGRITTTLDRAKEAGREAEKLITLAKRGDLHARRQVLRNLLSLSGNFLGLWSIFAGERFRTTAQKQFWLPIFKHNFKRACM